MTSSPAEHEPDTAEHDGDDVAGAALNRLMTRGYRFLHPRDSNGELAAVIGVRAHDRVIDVVRIEGEEEIVASRIASSEQDILNPRRPYWQRTGALDEVVDDLLELADGAYAPGAGDERFTGCWVPASSGRSRFLVAG